MKRRMCILALVLMLAMSIIPVTAFAATDEVAAQLRERTRRSYTSSLASYGKSSFHGYCATLVAYQLRYNGITKKVELCNGNEMYDRYKNKECTSGGYYIHPYSAKDYTLEQTLNVISENGTKDVYNILVGFQWTNTSAGRKYGHTVFINGILDGIVYFTESFDSATVGDEGTVGKLTIAQFAKMYGSWTSYEGCIYFTRNYAETLDRWETDLVVRARFSAQLRSQPCLVGQEDCQLLRSVYTGERLVVTDVLCDENGQWYYAVSDGDFTGYIVAQATALERMGTVAEGEARELYYVVEDRLESQIITQMPQANAARSVSQESVNGWICREGRWYYYENGQPHTGWLMEHGVRYYMDETGAAATGWTVINGQTCLFSATGALCTGWIKDTDGMRYCTLDGRFANEFHSVDGVLYYFQEGLLQSSGIVTDGTELYRVQPDGRAVLITEY